MVLEVRPQRHRPCKEGTHGLFFCLALQPRSELLLSRGKFLSLQTEVTSLINISRKVPGLHSWRAKVSDQPNLHVVQGTPATVRVPSIPVRHSPQSRYWLHRFHRDPGDWPREKIAGWDQE